MSDEDTIGSVIAKAIKHVISGPTVGGKLAGLERRLAALEARPSLRYCGVFKEGHAYGAGVLVTRNGGLWLAERDTDGTPGQADDGWRLVVKEARA